jgi:hypothetical protein
MKPPRTIMTFNRIWDGRAQKLARSLADAGWHAWLIARSETDRRETFTLARANVIKLPALPRFSTRVTRLAPGSNGVRTAPSVGLGRAAT